MSIPSRRGLFGLMAGAALAPLIPATIAADDYSTIEWPLRTRRFSWPADSERVLASFWENYRLTPTHIIIDERDYPTLKDCIERSPWGSHGR